MESIIDLRSDTVTQPTAAMRSAMAEAVVGDDVYGEDPTVNQLEEVVARLLGKEAAVFVPTGTMGNLISVLSHCGRGDEIILGDQAHIFLYEQGGTAAVGGIHSRTVPNRPDGTLDLDEVQEAVRATGNTHYPVSTLLALENTHNRCGGRVLPVDYMDAAGELAKSAGLKLHVDGARLWNAAVALDVPPARLVRGADSVSVCLSKGLAGPVGSVVAGGADFIMRARRMRKVVGGGMRQSGVLAAAGLLAVNEMVERLQEDHRNARLLADGLARIDGISLDPEVVETNILIFGLDNPTLTSAKLCDELARQGVRLSPIDGRRLRAVTNYHVSGGDIERTISIVEEIVRTGPAAT